MKAITIIPKSDEEYALVMAMLKKMRIKAAEAPSQPLRRMTMEEYNAMIEESLAAAREGSVISHSDLKKEMQQW